MMSGKSLLSQSIKLFLLCLFPILLQAKDLPRWEILPEQSYITFTAIQNNAPVSGQFKRFTGEIGVDPNHYESSKIHIEIDITSLSVSYRDLATMLLSADWFDVSNFPTASFTATHFNKIDENTYTAEGKLRIRDKTAPITLTFTAEEKDKNHTVVQGYTVLKRTIFGIGQGEWKEVSDLKDDVKITFKVTAKKLIDDTP